MMRRTAFGLALLALAALPAQAQQDCNVKIVSSLDLHVTGGGVVTVPVTLDDRPFDMLVDTGAYYSVITSHTAKVLGRETNYTTDMILVGWGRNYIDRFANLDSFGFGRFKRARTQFMVMDTNGAPFDGLLGADFLYYFDLDFDFAKAKLNLVSQDRCPGKAVYWTHGDYAVVPFDYKSHAIELTVNLDGKDIPVILDTGASDTVMSLEEAANLFNWDEKAKNEAGEHHSFKSLSFGGVTVANPSVHLVADRRSGVLGGRTKMLLGMNVLRRLHLYIAYKEEKLYVTPATQY